MRERILKVLEMAMDEVNCLLDKPIDFSNNLQLIGSSGVYNSLTFVAFIASAEELLEEEFGREIRLVNDRAFSKGNSPFYSITTLSNFIMELLEGTK